MFCPTNLRPHLAALTLLLALFTPCADVQAHKSAPQTQSSTVAPSLRWQDARGSGTKQEAGRNGRAPNR
ncbi:hypothetical protein PYK22_00851 [Pyrinomonas methylaliphatogenes]|uniref:Uncharacterized protein n=1 Tax=Pyrinomonas methylaliphatogenes TaxID=454194 RepID=A0A0B6WUV6_9BACT|nr:hypothetical protein PYK22_00851 [Pyrinomonas methylaliphatogenes]